MGTRESTCSQHACMLGTPGTGVNRWEGQLWERLEGGLNSSRQRAVLPHPASPWLAGSEWLVLVKEALGPGSLPGRAPPLSQVRL